MDNSDDNNSIMKIISITIEIIFKIGYSCLPIIGYYAQYLKIKKLKNSFGFSKFITFIIINAYIFRIFFRFGKYYNIEIFLQSLVGLFFQIFLLYKCIEYTHEKDKIYTDLFDIKYFWNWPFFTDYFIFISFTIISLSILSYSIGYDNVIYVETLGSISGLIEANMGVPQVFENFRTKNAGTFSKILIVSWISGDISKLIYLLLTNSPIQMTLSAFFQFIVDLIIIFQMMYYKQKVIS